MPHLQDKSAHHGLHRWELGAIALVGAAIAAPYVLPMLGVGDKVDAGAVTALCGTASGLTGMVEGLLGSVPGIGSWLVQNAGWGPSLLSGAIGIGGAVLGDYVHRHYDRKGHVQWGKVIKYAALTTSLLIALPSILSGISMGIAFAQYALGGFAPEALVAAKAWLAPTIGFSGVIHAAPTGLAALLPHLLTCGQALLPFGAALVASKASDAPAGQPSTGCSLQLVSHNTPLKGVPCEVAFRLIDNESGRVLTEDELEVVHTRKLHTMMVDSSLTDYHHLHPSYDPARKLFTCHFTPRVNGPYSMWNDVLVTDEPGPMHIKTSLSGGVGLPPRVRQSNDAAAPGLNVHISTQGPLRAGQANAMRIDITDAEGNPVHDLEPVMGAYAHLVGFTADGRSLIHTHPAGDMPMTVDGRGSSPLYFNAELPSSGGCKFFLQIQRGGHTITLPFGQVVAAETSHTARVSAPAHQHGSMAMA